MAQGTRQHLTSTAADKSGRPVRIPPHGMCERDLTAAQREKATLDSRPGRVISAVNALLISLSMNKIPRAVPPDCLIYYPSFVDGLRIELNIALLPEPGVAGRLVAASREFAERYPAIVRLDDVHFRLSFAPHLTLYQLAVPQSELPPLDAGLRKIANTERAISLACTELAYNAGEASLEARTESPTALAALQARVIDFANPLRDGILVERDPAGNSVRELLAAPGVLGENIRRTGYAEVGELFRPHATLNWFVPGTHVDVSREDVPVDIRSLGGRHPTLAMFVLGPHGTCVQALARYEFGNLPGKPNDN